MIFNTEMTVNPDEVRAFVESDKFIQFLLNNTTDFSVVTFILQAVLDRLDTEVDN